ncbi:unnamed protein product [Prorocentrum cordatum]|uniref:Uncharacterized protein n=1 Tax=Prorocentrum cordatum TaxID=2364126 RepID=A0ABN9TQ78_9DINO|nr:unnamed protein product [Polarella glacialis]
MPLGFGALLSPAGGEAGAEAAAAAAGPASPWDREADRVALQALVADRGNRLLQGQMSSDGVVDIWKVPLPQGKLLPRDYVDACGRFNMRPVCGGGQKCQYADQHCTVLSSMKKLCGVPMRSIAERMGLDDSDDPALTGVCTYMSARPRVGKLAPWSSGCCGGPNWCNPGNAVKGQRWALCAGQPQVPPRRPRALLGRPCETPGGPLPSDALAATFASGANTCGKVHDDVDLDDDGSSHLTRRLSPCELEAPTWLHAKLMCPEHPDGNGWVMRQAEAGVSALALAPAFLPRRPGGARLAPRGPLPRAPRRGGRFL